MNTPYFPLWRRMLGPMGQRVKALRQASPVEIEAQFKEFLAPDTLALSHRGSASRKRVFFLSRVFYSFIWQVLQPRTACRTVLRQIQAFCETETLHLGENTSGYCQARARLPISCVQAALKQSASAARRFCPEGVPGWKRPVKVVDATCIRLPDTQANRNVYPYAGCQRPGCGFPVMKVLALFCLASGAVLEAVCDAWKTGDMRLFLQILPRLHPGDILLGDRAFCGWFLLAKLPTLGVDVVARLRGSRLQKADPHRRLGPNEWLVTRERPLACPPYLTADQWRKLPAQITVRIIRSRLSRPGFRTHELWLCTTLLDPDLYPAHQIARLYLRRWEIELCFRDIKTTMGMEELRCRSPEMIYKELLIFLTAHNFIRCLVAQAAAAHHVPLTRISFKGAVDTARSFHSAMRLARTIRKARQLHARLLEILARDLIPYRPDRAEPRAVKKRPKPYQRLTKPRHCYRETPHRGKRRGPNPCLS